VGDACAALLAEPLMREIDAVATFQTAELFALKWSRESGLPSCTTFPVVPLLLPLAVVVGSLDGPLTGTVVVVTLPDFPFLPPDADVMLLSPSDMGDAKAIDDDAPPFGDDGTDPPATLPWWELLNVSPAIPLAYCSNCCTASNLSI
jgi:hypothetical protein